jgi:hypothetical protein
MCGLRLKLYCENELVVLYVAKHINIKFYVVKEKIKDQAISLEHISTKKMIADLLMKGLSPSVFREHLAGLGLRESL